MATDSPTGEKQTCECAHLFPKNILVLTHKFFCIKGRILSQSSLSNLLQHERGRSVWREGEGGG